MNKIKRVHLSFNISMSCILCIYYMTLNSEARLQLMSQPTLLFLCVRVFARYRQTLITLLLLPVEPFCS